jgi:simple sugar transport system ATP-binding protein
MAATDQVTVMRRGAVAKQVETGKTDVESLAAAMIGRPLAGDLSPRPFEPGLPVLGVAGLRVCDDQGIERVKGIDLTLREGEIVGIAGVAGNGQSELLACLAGMREAAEGRLLWRGRLLTGRADVRTRRALGIAHVPEDRQGNGLVAAFTAAENLILGSAANPAAGTGAVLRWRRIRSHAASVMADWKISPADPSRPTALFSGGNQQKLVCAREMARQPVLLLAGQPTRGVDVGAIEFIHRRLLDLRERGVAILLVSAELDEILALCDRILVMVDGRIVGETTPATVTERELGMMMAGVSPHATTPNDMATPLPSPDGRP